MKMDKDIKKNTDTPFISVLSHCSVKHNNIDKEYNSVIFIDKLICA